MPGYCHRVAPRRPNANCPYGIQNGSRPPSTRPSPHGEGETCAASLEIPAAGLAGWSSANQNHAKVISSPGGEDSR
jgi:hypothetical protein